MRQDNPTISTISQENDHIPPNRNVDVYILTYCKNLQQLYGNTLIFKTLRIGFPTANITVVDNASIAYARGVISKCAKDTGCAYRPLQDEILHHQFLEYIVNSSKGTVVFLDPDICFWGNCEKWDFSNYLLAGRLLPQFQDEYTQCITEARIHTSFLWINSCSALNDAIQNTRRTYFEYEPFKPVVYMEPISREWYRFDTLSLLYTVLKERIYCFNSNELDTYDHLFCGTHFPIVYEKLTGNDKSVFKNIHEYAKHDYKRLKGIWKFQEEYFVRRGKKEELKR